MFQSQKEVNAIIFINVDISQGLQAISLPFTDCALNEVIMNGCTFSFFLLCLDLNGDGVEDGIQCLNP